MIDDDRHHQRYEREEGREDEGEHDQRAEATERGLDENAGALVVGARVLKERVEAGQMDRAARDGGALERLACGLLRGRVLAEGRVRVRLRVDDRERRGPVLGDEGVIAGRGVGGDT